MEGDKDLIIFLAFIAFIFVIGMTAYVIEVKMEQTTAQEAMKVGYCSYLNPPSTQLLWTKCDDKKSTNIR